MSEYDFCEDKNRPERPLACHVDALPDGLVSYALTQEMTQPDNSPHVRSVAIYLPLMEQVPTVTARIISDANAALLMITSLKINHDVGGYLQVAIAAQTLFGAKPAVGTHYCNIVAIGKPKPR